MRFSRVIPVVAISLISSVLIAQQAARAPQADKLLQSALTAMGGTAPPDSTATGKVVVVEGSKTLDGAIRILTRGTDQSAEHIELPGENRSVIHSRGESNETARGVVKWSPLEISATSYSPDFPLPLLAAAFADPNTALEYIGEETIEGAPTHHIRFWNTYGSNHRLREHLSEFTRKDVWLDASTGLPNKLAYERREGHGAVPRIRMEIFYSDWRIVTGVNYPHRIEKTWNGTPWITITVDKVAVQTGLSDTDFPVKSRTEVQQ
jgi:hypothetical protein